jgi:integrase
VPLFFVAPAGQMGQGRFVRTEDGPIEKAWFYEKVWGPALLRAGIRDEPDPERKAPAGRDGNGPQCLRHYFASACLAGGEGVAAVAEWMGHHSPVITLHSEDRP